MARADLENAKALYPSCAMGVDEWVRFFSTPPGMQAMGKIIYDIYDEVKSAEERAAGVRRIGRRPARASVPLDEVMGIVTPVEFTNDPMPKALTRLIAGRSQRQFAAKVPMNQGYLSKILAGEKHPELDTIEALAKAAGVAPWYFVEWRARYVGSLITEVLHRSPHLGISAVRGLRDNRRRAPAPGP